MNNKKDLQKKHRLGTVSKNSLEGLNMLNGTNLTLKAKFFLLADLRDFFFRFRVGGRNKIK